METRRHDRTHTHTHADTWLTIPTRKSTRLVSSGWDFRSFNMANESGWSADRANPVANATIDFQPRARPTAPRRMPQSSTTIFISASIARHRTRERFPRSVLVTSPPDTRGIHLARTLRGCRACRASRATSPFSLPRADHGGLLRSRVPGCPCVVSFSKFREPDTPDSLPTSR